MTATFASKSIPAAIVLFLSSSLAHAQSVDVAAAAKTEAGFNAAEAVLWRQHRLLEIQKKVDESRRDAEASVAQDNALLSGLPVGNLPPPAATAPPVPAAPATPPPPEFPFRLASVWGIEGKYQVVIQSGQMRQMVTLGSALPGGWTLVGVDAGGIRMRKGSQIKTMAFGE